MNGLGNKLSAAEERRMTTEAIEKFVKKIQETGKVPGTHSLGAEFKTK